ncbi:placenta-specific protein 9 [Microcaecilia unicolor]|uniref:Placenta-specific protein 9-like n=1 Tax=Microcaecilia unicolor TaxID=1415580 RepID=A0A6P7Y6X1_9AMPH|nr:placenta-specific protein 9-like [Microcaecilia unicolor]
MRALFALTFLLIMTDQRFSEADPSSASPGSAARSAWCTQHKTLHTHLDAIEEKVEKTVEYLYSEVKTLLDTITDTAQSPPLPTGIPILDIFDDDSS